MGAKIYTHAVKAGGKIIAAGVPVEVGVTPESVFTDEFMTEHTAEEAQAAFDSLKKALETLDFNKMKKAELEDYATLQGISLDGVSTKAEYIDVIRMELARRQCIEIVEAAL